MTCDHRQSDGQNTDAQFSAGDECPECQCTLGTDGYWYIDADQAPGYPFKPATE